MDSKLLILSLLLISKLAIGQYANPSANRIFKDLSILASDSLQGRDAGSIGGEKAAVYIANQMKEIGLKPAGDYNDSYFRRFTMNYPVRFKKATLTINKMQFEYPSDFGATDFSASGAASGELVDVGSGIFDVATAIDDYKGVDVKGKIVLFDVAIGAGFGDLNEALLSIESRVKTAEKRGAIAILLHNSTRKGIEDVMFGSPFIDSISIPVLYIARIPFGKIKKTMKANCSLSAEIKRTTSRPANVVGIIDNKAKKTVVIGAHYDHLGLTINGDENGRHEPYNGADDNASGTAMLLELARWANNNESLKYNYLFVAFSAEEKGLFGSKAFAKAAEINPSNIAYMLNMDMVGRLGCQGDTISILGVGTSAVWNSLIDKLDSPDFHIKKIQGAPPFSDHAPFVKKEIPVAYFTTGIHKQYHTPADDIELINIQGMVEVYAYIRNFIRNAEILPEIPFDKLNFLQQSRAYISVF